MSVSKSLLLLLGQAGTRPPQQHADYPIQAVPFMRVKLTDSFRRPRLQTNTDVPIPASVARCGSTNRIKDFEMAGARQGRFATVFPLRRQGEMTVWLPEKLTGLDLLSQPPPAGNKVAK